MRRSRRGFGLLAAAALITAACGGDDDELGAVGAGASTTAAASAPEVSDAGSTADSTPPADSTAPADTGTTGTADTSDPSNTGDAADGSVSFSEDNEHRADVDRTGETIRIGVQNAEGPTYSNPEMRTAILTAIDVINANGGVNGATLEPVECVSDATPEGAIDCANQFVEAAVDLVTYGAEPSMDAAIPIFEEAGLAVISDFAYNQTPSENVWGLSAPLGAFAMYPLVALKEDIGATKVAFMAIDTPFFRFQAELFDAWSEIVGIETVTGPFVDPGTGDWTSAVQTVLAEGVDAFIIYTPSNHVQGMITTARQLGFEGPVVTTDTRYIEALGAPDALNTYVISPRYTSSAVAASAPQQIQDNFELYEQAMTDAGHEDLIAGYAENQFATMMDVATILEMIPEGPIDLESISAALSVDRSIIGFDSADFNCGAHPWPADPSFCRAYQLVAEVEERDGELVQIPVREENFGFYFLPELNAQSTTLFD
jgi:branched-chain amino acid transport system substrate-binding protein